MLFELSKMLEEKLKDNWNYTANIMCILQNFAQSFGSRKIYKVSDFHPFMNKEKQVLSGDEQLNQLKMQFGGVTKK